MNLSLLKKHRIGDEATEEQKLKVYRAVQNACYKYGKLYHAQSDPEDLAQDIYLKLATPQKHRDGTYSTPIDEIDFRSDAELQSFINNYCKQRFIDLNRAASNNMEVHAQERSDEDDEGLTFDKAAGSANNWDDEPVNTSSGSGKESSRDTSLYDLLGDKKQLMKLFQTYDQLPPSGREAFKKNIYKLLKDVDDPDPKVVKLIEELFQDDEGQNQKEPEVKQRGDYSLKKTPLTQDVRDEVEELVDVPEGAIQAYVSYDDAKYSTPDKLMNVPAVFIPLNEEARQKYTENKNKIDELLAKDGYEFNRINKKGAYYLNPSNAKEHVKKK